MERTARSRKGSNWANEAMGTSPKGGGQPGWSPLPGKRRKTGDASAFRNQQKCRSCFRYRGSRSWVDLMNAAGTSKDMIKPHVWSAPGASQARCRSRAGLERVRHRALGPAG